MKEYIKKEEGSIPSKKERALEKCKYMATSWYVVFDSNINCDGKEDVVNMECYSTKELALADFERRERALRDLYEVEKDKKPLNYREGDNSAQLVFENGRYGCSYYTSLLSFEEFLRRRTHDWLHNNIITQIRITRGRKEPFHVSNCMFEGHSFYNSFRSSVTQRTKALFDKWMAAYLRLEPDYFEQMLCEVANQFCENQVSSTGGHSYNCRYLGSTTIPKGTVYLIYQDVDKQSLEELDSLKKEYMEKARTKNSNNAYSDCDGDDDDCYYHHEGCDCGMEWNIIEEGGGDDLPF